MSNPHKVLGTGRWKAVRLKVLQRDGYICAYCGQDANSVDHIVPRKVGGDVFDMDNLVASCKRCNSKKGAKETAFFLSVNSTPPVFLDSSLPDTTTTIPTSPFIKPSKAV